MEIHEILIYGVAALACFILAVLVRGNRQAVLQFATDLINKAEGAIQGSGMGADKKALVIAQLQAAGIKVSGSLVPRWDNIRQLAERNKAEKSIEREYRAMLKQYNLQPSSAEVTFARGMANGTYTMEDIHRRFDGCGFVLPYVTQQFAKKHGFLLSRRADGISPDFRACA